jgi:hypothetical protein
VISDLLLDGLLVAAEPVSLGWVLEALTTVVTSHPCPPDDAVVASSPLANGAGSKRKRSAFSTHCRA